NNHRDAIGGLFGCDYRRARRGSNPCNERPDEISRQGWQSIVVAIGPTVFDRNILPLEVTRFAQALLKCCHLRCIAAGGTSAGKTDRRHRRPPRPRAERAPPRAPPPPQYPPPAPARPRGPPSSFPPPPPHPPPH